MLLKYDENKRVYSLKSSYIEAIIGDEKQPDSFLPRLKLKVWDNECNISIGLPVDETQKEKISVIEDEKGLLTWKQGKREAHFYPIEPSEEHPEGGYEFEVILDEKPESNIIEFTLNDPKDLKFYYQPEISDEEAQPLADREGITLIEAKRKIRPDNVVGSYAVYHASKSNNKYKAGKAFHIYRPKIIDVNGDWVWGELNIDESAQILTVTIPQKWLDGDVYPVTVDPTFGYTSAGASWRGYLNGNSWGSRYSSSEDANATTITAKLKPHTSPTYNGNCSAALYEYVSGTPGKLNYTISHVDGSDGVMVDGDNWYDFTVNTAISAKEYVLLAWSNGFRMFAYDTGGSSNQGLQHPNSEMGTYGASPTVWQSSLDSVSTWTTDKYSIYVTYEESATSETYNETLSILLPV